MGRLQAEEMANAGLSIDVALGWHLQSNHYPPVPTYMNPIAKRAIELVVADEVTAILELPEGVTFQGFGTIRAGQVVEAYHLESFVDAALSDGEEE